MPSARDFIEQLGFELSERALRTTGLENFERLNFDILIDDPLEAQIAERILREAAAHSVLHTEVKDGERISVPLYRGQQSPVGSVAYRATKVLSQDTQGDVLRLSSVFDSGPPVRPALELATEALEVAHEAVAAGAMEKALEIAVWSASLFPGAPLQGKPGPEQAHPNARNYHAYELLFELTGNPERYLDAFERSVSLQRSALGSAAWELASAVADLVRRDALRAQVSKVQQVLAEGIPRLSQTSKELEAYPAPLLLHRDGLVRPLCTMSIAMTGLYYSDEARVAFEASAAIDLCTEVLQHHAAAPYALAMMTRSPMFDWLSFQDSELVLEWNEPSGLEQICSAVFATIAMCKAGDFSWDEVRVYFGLSEENIEAVAAKQERLLEIRSTLGEMRRFMSAQPE